MLLLLLVARLLLSLALVTLVSAALAEATLLRMEGAGRIQRPKELRVHFDGSEESLLLSVDTGRCNMLGVSRGSANLFCLLRRLLRFLPHALATKSGRLRSHGSVPGKTTEKEGVRVKPRRRGALGSNHGEEGH